VHAYQPERLNPEPKTSNALVAVAMEHPALFAGAALSLIVMASIFANAVFYQSGKHPSPLFSTRNMNVVQPIEEPVKTASRSADKKQAPELVETAKDNTSKELLREVQTALSVRGYYTGKLDGVYGSRTKKAITSFQQDHSLKADGNPSLRLLTQVLMSASARPQAVPVPKPVEVVAAPKKVKTVRVTAKKTPEIEVADGLVARIQSGLRNYGYDDLQVDGKMGQQTATAIQRFQLDYGMKITGEPSKTVLKKLSEIGAYRQG